MTAALITENISGLIVQRQNLQRWIKDNMDKLGSIEFRKHMLALRLVVDLIAAHGGTEAQRSFIAEKLKEIENGTHPDLAGLKPFRGG
jgi:hypothetical protein